ncbi:hypothetical protein HJD18_08165 [Thermoleophilia bacterium SCSIO 60948]|nr:hypothetical protein HJD18_08165 [Thermoleophilia bacterium SCSIO 60948]
MSANGEEGLARALAYELLEAGLGDRIAEALRSTSGDQLVDAATLARRLGVSRDFIYRHADELGALHLPSQGDSGRPRLRFEPDTAAAALRRVQGPAGDASRSTPARTRRSPYPVPLLEIKEKP